MCAVFTPERFPDRKIYVDENVYPPIELMNCMKCDKMTGRLFKNLELCEGCYREWSLDFCKDWMRIRFGTVSA